MTTRTPQEWLKREDTRVKRVTIYTPERNVSGGEVVLLNLLAAGTAQTYDITVACPKESALERRLTALGVNTRPFVLDKIGEAGPIAFAMQFARAIADVGRTLRAGSDLGHIFIPQGLKIVGPLLRASGVPSILSVHSILTPRAIGRMNARIDRTIAKTSVDRIIAVSDYVAESLRGFGYPQDRIRVVHNGLNPEGFCGTLEQRNRVRGLLGLRHDDVLFAIVGRLTEWKGHSAAIRALDAIRASRLHALPHLVIVGSPFYPSDDGYAESLVRLVRSRDLEGHVHFLPKTDSVSTVYAAADVVVVPSVSPDPFPTVVLEAGASGRPVIATTLGGAREAIIDGRTGILAEPTPEILAKAMTRLLDERTRSEMGRAARDHIGRNFSDVGYRARIESVWRELISDEL